MSNRQQRREKQKAARQERRNAKAMAQIERRNENAAARRERKAVRVESKAEKRKNKSLKHLSQVQTAAQNLPEDWTPQEMPLGALTKATNYMKRMNRKIEDDKDPEIVGAQFMETRAQQIAMRHDAKEREIMEDPSLTPEEQEERMPDFEDIEEEILEEEFNSFSFTGDEDNFLDPDTVAMLIRAGKAGADKYRQKRFEQGKKAFGKTEEQWKAKQKEIEAGGTAAQQALIAAKERVVKEKTDETIKENTPYIIGGVIVLIIVGVAIYYAGKNN